MPKKTIFIFIASFIVVGAIMLGVYFFSGSSTTNTTTQGGDTTNSGYQSFSPFGGSSNTNNTDGSSVGGVTNEQNVTINNEQGSQSSKFHKITNFAVAGATFFEDTRPLPIVEEIKIPSETKDQPALTPTPKNTKNSVVDQPKVITQDFETVPSLRYVEKVTGHIYQMYLDNGASAKISNSTIPSIYETLFDSTAKTIIYRYLSTDNKTIESFMTTLGTPRGEFIPENIVDISLSPDGKKFFYLTKNFSGITGTVRVFGDTKRTQVFTSSFTEWLSQWVGDQKIFLTTKASWAVPGDLFSLNTLDGSLIKVFGGVNGLTTLANKSGSRVLYSISLNSGPRLGIFNINNHTTEEINSYGLPEKCVWSNDNITIYCASPSVITGSQYPDSWYQGLVSFDDHFISIDSNTGNVYNVADSNTETPIDATHLFLDKSESNLFFINKKDSTLWSLNLK